ncbi:MAG: K+/H+ antiporter subunit F [Gemmatimonadota bacterium]
MLNGALTFGFAAMAIAMVLNLYRLVRGPDVADRVVALDTLYINVIAVLMLVGLRIGSDIFFEAALLIAMMGFVGTVALAKHMRRGSIIE